MFGRWKRQASRIFHRSSPDAASRPEIQTPRSSNPGPRRRATRKPERDPGPGEESRLEWRVPRPQLGRSGVGGGQPSPAAVSGRGSRCAGRPEFEVGVCCSKPLRGYPKVGGCISGPLEHAILVQTGPPAFLGLSPARTRRLPEVGTAPQGPQPCVSSLLRLIPAFRLRELYPLLGGTRNLSRAQNVGPKSRPFL